MYKWAIAGLVAAAFATIFLAGPLLSWVGQFGTVTVLVVALVFRLMVLALVVWLAVSFFHRHRGHESRL